MAIQDNIDEFCSYFVRQIDMINNLNIKQEDRKEVGPADYQVRFYKKALIVTTLDTLAGIRFPKESYPDLHKKNRERFIQFISEYGSWDHGPLVSTSLLLDKLTSIGAQNGILATYLKTKLSRYNHPSGISLPPSELDESTNILMPMAATEKEEKSICYYQHFALLYRYRNFLIHEAREPGYAMESIHESHAYYRRYSEDPKWYLVYPVKLFITLLSKSIKNLKIYFQEQKIDPYLLNS